METIYDDNRSEDKIPAWFGEYTHKLRSEERDLLEEVKKIEQMKFIEVCGYLGGDISQLPYVFLATLFVNGSDDEKIVGILRKKREQYLTTHPEEWKGGAKDIVTGITTFDGRFIPKRIWDTAKDSEKRGALVGSTCFHYNSGTPGMDSDPDDRF